MLIVFVMSLSPVSAWRPQELIFCNAQPKLLWVVSEGSPTAADYLHWGTIHPQGSATSSAVSGRALPPCNTTPLTSDALRLRVSRNARIPITSLVVTWLPAII